MSTEPEFTAPDGTVRKEHYGSGRQPWDDIVDVGWGPEFAAGNALKYVRRYKAKNGADDLEKGRWYYARLKEMVLNPQPLTTEAGPYVHHHLVKLLTSEELGLLENPDAGRSVPTDR